MRRLALASARGLHGPAACPSATDWRFAARLASLVELLTGMRNFRLIPDRPRPERRNRNQEVAAERRQRVIDPRRNGRIGGARDQAVAFEPAQRQRQHALRNAANRAAQLVETQRPAAKPGYHQDRPFVADAGQHIADHAAIRRQMNLTGLHDGASRASSYEPLSSHLFSVGYGF